VVEEALVDAHSELEALRAREFELIRLIERAEAALGERPSPEASSQAANLTLHDALVQVLSESPDEWMTVHELTQAVNERGLYHKRDGSPVEANQVHARTNNYRAIFEKDGASVRLRKESALLTQLPESITLFKDDDRGFLEWLDEHPDGVFVNADRNPKANYLVLHRPSCPHFTGNPSVNWTKAYIKICSDQRADLEEWAVDAVGGEPTLCPRCFG
jgi:hypothetical protein